MDFVTLPETPKGNDTAITVTDRLSKRVRLIATKKTADAPTVARLFFQEVVRNFGVPRAIISDRDPRVHQQLLEGTNTHIGREPADEYSLTPTD